MARKHELEIEITADGEVKVHVKGAKGKQCLQYVELLATMGEVKDKKMTSEYYEPEPTVDIVDHARTRFSP